MSYEQAYEFDSMDEEGEMTHFIDEMDEENRGSDEGFDEYEMVCFTYFLIWLVCVFSYAN